MIRMDHRGANMTTAENAKILIVDDNNINIDMLLAALSDYPQLAVCTDGQSALEYVGAEIPDLILLDIMMPIMDGYEVCRRLKSKTETRDIPIIFLTAHSDERHEAEGLRLGAVDYITKPFNPLLVHSRVRNQLELKRHRDHLETLVQDRTRELLMTQDVIITSMGVLAEFRDPETGDHIKRTQRYVRLLADRLRDHPDFSGFLTKDNIELLFKSAPLHDIGKIGVPDSILLKPGRLTPDEFEEMKRHTIYGHDAIQRAKQKLGDNSFLNIAQEIALTHHERWDGGGYPNGLKETGIPISGRLMAVADVYDALTSRRVYKDAMSHEDAMEIMSKERESHFDPVVFDTFASLEATFREISIEHAA